MTAISSTSSIIYLETVTVDWINREEDELSAPFQLPPPYQDLSIWFERCSGKNIYLCGSKRRPLELQLSIVWVNDEKNTSIVLREDRLRETMDGTVSGTLNFKSQDSKSTVGAYKDGSHHFRIHLPGQKVEPPVGAMAANLGHAFEQEICCDVTIFAGGIPIKANKFTLMAQSDVFRAMFERDWNEGKNNEVKVEDVDYEPMMALIKFLYTEHVEFNENVLLRSRF